MRSRSRVALHSCTGSRHARIYQTHYQAVPTVPSARRAAGREAGRARCWQSSSRRTRSAARRARAGRRPGRPAWRPTGRSSRAPRAPWPPCAPRPGALGVARRPPWRPWDARNARSLNVIRLEIGAASTTWGAPRRGPGRRLTARGHAETHADNRCCTGGRSEPPARRRGAAACPRPARTWPPPPEAAAGAAAGAPSGGPAARAWTGIGLLHRSSP